MTHIAIRVDAHPAIGFGHLSRCLSLAQTLRAKGMAPCFFSADPLEAAQAAGFPVCPLPSRDQPEDVVRALLAHRLSADWLIVDSYQLDASWESALRPHCRHLLAIDDLADRQHDADLLVDPGPLADPQRYATRVNAGCTLLLGPDYALLRPEFAARRPRQPPLSGQHEHSSLRAHLAFGGGDAQGHTLRAATALQAACPTLGLHIVLGRPDDPQSPALAALAARMPQQIELRHAPADVAAGMARCHLALGAPGTMLWERACMGLPTACWPSAPNQIALLHELAEQGWLCYLGEIGEQGAVPLEKLHDWLANRPALEASARRIHQAVDGQGANRLAAMIEDTLR